MVGRADVFIQNLANGASARLGLGASDLMRDRPDLICCDISGFGAVGPYVDRKAYDLLIQAESGLVSVSGGPGEMGRVGASVADIGAGLNAYGAITTALVRATRTGKGAHIRVSLFDTLAEWMTIPLLHYDYRGAAPTRVGLAHPSIAPYGAFDSVEGHQILISIQSDHEWRALCDKVLERPEFAEDERFRNNNARVANREETDRIVADAISDMTMPMVRRKLDNARIAYGQVNDMAGLSNHQHLRRRTVTHELGAARLPETAVEADWAGSAHAPALNEHGDAIRKEFGK
jgi:itaconate CoA-transferase